MKMPDFWYPRDPAKPLPWTARLLGPLSRLYQKADRWKRARITPQRAEVPVICVGNLTTGGTGKTPVVMFLAEALKAEGLKPVLLTRGYGGVAVGPEQVDPARHTAEDVGDEALLLARVAPTVVAANRVEGAKLATDMGADLIIMDDGFQNPSLRKDFSLLVVDGQMGFGNGRIFPQGPLRETPEEGMGRADAVVVMGGTAAIAKAMKRYRKPLFRAELTADREALARLNGQSYLAFAGIGHPQKFFETARSAGLRVKSTRPYPDHFLYDDVSLNRLFKSAEADGLALLTTAKDAVRLPPPYREGVAVLDVHAKIQRPEKLLDLVREKTGLTVPSAA